MKKDLICSLTCICLSEIYTSSSISNSPTEYMQGEELNRMARSRKLMVMIFTVQWGRGEADLQTPVHSTWTHAHMFICLCCMMYVVSCLSAAH